MSYKVKFITLEEENRRIGVYVFVDEDNDETSRGYIKELVERIKGGKAELALCCNKIEIIGENHRVIVENDQKFDEFWTLDKDLGESPILIETDESPGFLIVNKEAEILKRV